MAQDILYNCLSGEIKSKDLFDWIVLKKYSDVFMNSSPGEFISLFLNFIHESAISASIDANTPQKIEHTPKSIRPPRREASKARRRPALFSDHSKQPIQSENNVEELVGITNVNPTDKSPVTSDRSKTNASLTHAQSEICQISPLHSIHTPIRWRYQPLKQSTPEPSKGPCLGDFFINSGTGKKCSAKKKGQRINRDETDQNRQQKRINPILHHTNSGHCNLSGNSFNFENIQKTNQIFNTPAISDNNPATLSNSMDINVCKDTPCKNITPNRNVEIEPDLTLVKHAKFLDNCSNIYLFLLKNNLTLNILRELYFLITLLLTRKFVKEAFAESDCKDINVRNLKDMFGSVHNVVYFASNILRELKDFLRIFDRATIKFLLDNSRVATFVKISKELEILYNDKLAASPPHPSFASNTTPIYEVSPSISTCTVHFAADTDGRPNFTSDAAFNAFRRQRDTFYDLLRAWQHHHNNVEEIGDRGASREWNMAVRVRQLLGMNVEGETDYRHLARLWRGQMMVDCCSRQGQLWDQSNSSPSDTHLISALPHLNPDKLTLLRSRLTTRQPPATSTSNGSSSLPSSIAVTFPGIQEFYRDFIIAADSAAWNYHLRDSLISELMKIHYDTCKEFRDKQKNLLENPSKKQSNLNETTYTNSTLAGSSIIGQLSSSKMLAKILGLLESVPYYYSNIIHQNKIPQSRNLSAIEGSSVETSRKYYQPTLDILGCVEQAVMEGSFVMTVPWVVEYCAMLDADITKLTYYEKVFKIFFQIYHESKQDFNNNCNNLIHLCLEWLFELPQFPSELYYTWYNDRITRIVETDLICHPKSNIYEGVKQSSLSIGSLDIIDESIVNAICPYVGKFRRLLLSNHSCHNNVTVKHITPVTAIEEKNSEVTQRKIRVQLEEAFFNAHPASVRKIVDFVSERVASTSVKIICNKIVPAYRKSAVDSFKMFLHGKKVDDSKSDDLKAMIDVECKEFQARSLKYLQIICSSEAKQIIQDRVFITVELLLSDEELPQTKVTCGEIAARFSYEKVQHWISTHVNIGVLSKDFQVEVDKFIIKCNGVALTAPEFKFNFQLPPDGRCTNHNDETLNAVTVVEEIRRITISTLENPLNITNESIDGIIKDACDTLTQRCDVNDCILFLINKLLLDLLILLVAHNSEFVTPILIEKFIKFWSNYCFIETTNLNSTKHIFSASRSSELSISSQYSVRNSTIDATNFNDHRGANITKRLFSGIICPRNVMILSYGRNDRSFFVFAMFIVQLLQRDLITCIDVGEQVVALNRCRWNDEIRRRITIFLQELGEGCKIMKTGEKFETLPSLLRIFSAWNVD